MLVKQPSDHLRVGFCPSSGDGYPFERASESKRIQALTVSLDRKTKRDVRWLPLRDLWQRLEGRAKASIVSDPLFYRWARDYVADVSSQTAEPDESLRTRLGGLLIGAAIQRGLAYGSEIEVAGLTASLTTLAGTRWRLVSASPNSPLPSIFILLNGATFSVRTNATLARCTHPTSIFCTPGEPFNFCRGVIAEPRFRAEDQFEFAGEPEALQHFLDGLPSENQASRMSVQSPVSCIVKKRVRCALHSVRHVWPELHAELLRQIKMIVPYEGSYRRSFTNPEWQGIVFFNAVAMEEDCVALIDILVHEAAHLYLNTYLSVATLHCAPRDTLMQSPFREGWRPVDAVFHGVFVFARMLAVRRRLFPNAPLQSESEVEWLEKIHSGIFALRKEAMLSAAGSDLLNCVEDAVARG